LLYGLKLYEKYDTYMLRLWLNYRSGKSGAGL
jgi:hypothetical protein